MGTRGLRLCVLVVVLLAPVCAWTEDSGPDLVTITLKDGGSLVGAIVAEDATTITLRTTSGVELRLPKDAIASRGVAPAKTVAQPAPPLSDPNESRLMFAPTGRPLGKGNGHFSDHYVVFPGFAYGLTRNLSVGGGVSVIPALGLSEQVFYVSASAGWKLDEKAALAFGGFFASAPSEDLGGAALYGVATLGHTDRSLSVGLAAVAERDEEYLYDRRGAYTDSRTTWRFREAPVAMVGGSLRLARHVSLISETWLFLGDEFKLSEQPFGFGVRFFNGRLSADVGLVLVGELLDEGFPLPWLSFSYHFGPSRRAASRNAVAPAWASTTARRGR